MSFYLFTWLVGISLLILGAIVALAPPRILSVPIRKPYDKLLHAVYCCIAMFMFYDFLEGENNLIHSAVIVLSLSFVAEVVQEKIPSRNFSRGDLLANIVGVAIATSSIMLFEMI